MWLKFDVGYWHNPTWLKFPWEAPIIFAYICCEVSLFGVRKDKASVEKRLSAEHWQPEVVAHVLRLPDVDGVRKAMEELEKRGKVTVDNGDVSVPDLAEYQSDPTAAERKARYHERHGTQDAVPERNNTVPERVERVLNGQNGQDQRDQKDQKQKKEEGGGPLSLALGEPDRDPCEEMTERQIEAYEALGEIRFLTTTDGPVLPADIVKDRAELARDLGGPAYPAVESVRQQLASAAGYCRANPKRAKTARGLERFIVDWFRREQNHPSSRPARWENGNGKPLDAAPRGNDFSRDLTQVVAKLAEGLDK
jgi:hypothetical protein